MDKQIQSTGLSRDLIIHPGETLEEVLSDRNMSQKELAVRTGFTEKHVSTVINRMKPISVAFAMKLEVALGIEASFWIRLQANYDQQLMEFEEINGITDNEIDVIGRLSEIIENGCSAGWLTKTDDPVRHVLELRRKLGISNLLAIPNLPRRGAFRAQAKDEAADPYVSCAEQAFSEWMRRNGQTEQDPDIEKPEDKFPAITEVKFAEDEK